MEMANSMLLTLITFPHFALRGVPLGATIPSHSVAS